MKCQKCGKYDALTHITEITNGKKTEVFLCPLCAQSIHPANTSFFGHDDDFGNLFSSLWSLPDFSGLTHALKCPNCKSTLSDIQKSGRLGCSECYTVFFDYLKKPLNEIHKSLRHVGKTPKKFSENPETQGVISHLEAELKRAVEAENFEEAARLRDRLKDLKNSFKEA